MSYLIFELAGIKLAVYHKNPKLKELVKDFLSKGEPDYSLYLNYKPKISAKPNSVACKQGEYIIQYNNISLSYKPQEQRFDCELYKISRRSWVHLLTFCFFLILNEHKGHFFHSAGIVHKGKGYLFVGKKRVGKSTLAKLSGSPVINDDCNIVRIIGNSPFIYPNFLGGILINQLPKTQLAGIIFPEQAPNNKLTKLMPISALKKTLSQNLFFSTNFNFSKNPFLSREFSNTFKLLNTVPSYLLRFNLEIDLDRFLK